jgi:hypothetical protein
VAVATGRVMTRNVHLVGQRLKEIELAEGLDGRRMAEALRITDVNWSRYKSGTRASDPGSRRAAPVFTASRLLACCAHANGEDEANGHHGNCRPRDAS